MEPMEQMEGQQTSTNNKNESINPTIIDKFFGYIEKMGGLIDKYGIKGTFELFVMVFIAIMIGYYAFNPNAIISKAKEIQQIEEVEHREAITKRKEATPIIKTKLIDLREAVNADRAFVFETHNGGSNLEGLPFLYVDMTYDEPKGNLHRIQDEYKNLSQSRYPLMDEIYLNSFYFCEVEDLMEKDPELYYRLKKDGTKYFAIMVMYGQYNPCGCVGVQFCGDEVPDSHIVAQELQRYASQITPLITSVKE